MSNAPGVPSSTTGFAPSSAGRSCDGSLRSSLRDLPRAIVTQSVLAGALIVIVGFTGSLVLTFDIADNARLTHAQLSSWVWTITVGSGLLSLGLSLWYKQPVLARGAHPD
ncbi:MAG: hypothetical protein HC933_23245, partial [Pleurocapsa sp. SU_196_0]|nr:hypothetical protein [Pleurocapsa sp. SU_196_0]